MNFKSLKTLNDLPSMPHNLVENVDYYYDDDGFMVLTDKYHLERGSCCGNGCMHCPYEYINVPEPARSKILSLKNHANKKD